ncbi:MAG: nucleotide exchange factor GrpE [Candidatus Cryptobacteroides sp.]
MANTEDKNIEQEMPQTETPENIAEETVEATEVKEDKKESKKEKKERKKVEDLEKQIEALNESIKKEKDDYLRLMAEFDNFRRRTSQEKLDLVNTASEDTIKGLLPILDDFERAVKALAETDDSAAAKEGTELIFNKMMTYLKTKGLAVIEAAGADFDTDLHEAVAQFPVQEDEKKGKVFDVVQTGYTLKGKVIRYAKVVVGI